MKIKMSYALTVMDDDGETIGSANADLNVPDFTKLVKLFLGTTESVATVIAKHETKPDSDFAKAVADLLATTTESTTLN